MLYRPTSGLERTTAWINRAAGDEMPGVRLGRTERVEGSDRAVSIKNGNRRIDSDARFPGILLDPAGSARACARDRRP
jgi:hypothetical protein